MNVATPARSIRRLLHPRILTPFTISPPSQQCRCVHNRLASRPVPPPTPFVPDVQTLFKLIGRNTAQHAAKIPSWEALFTLPSEKFKALGIEPAAARKYIFRWRERFRQGVYGVGGDLTHVSDGVGELKLVEVPVANPTKGLAALATATRTPGTRKVVVNVPAGQELPDVPLELARPVNGIKVRGTNSIAGPYIQTLPGSRGLKASLAVTEGLWEDKKGRKIDGGERRRAEVRAKRASEERKKARAAAPS
jgi:IGR protein motif